MPLTLDANTALVVIDLQKGTLNWPIPTAHPVKDILARSAELCKAFRSKNLPVILVNVAGRPPGRSESKMNLALPPDWTELAPELDRQPSDYTVTKLQVGAFYGTALDLILRRHHVTQVVLVGIATSVGVETTARNAYDYGFNVVTVTDAMTDMDPESHKHSVEKVFPKISERATTEEVLALLK